MFFIYLVYENSNLEIVKSTYYNEKIPDSFNNFKICQISDLHNTEFGKDNKNLIKKISEQEPDIIVITGDIIDRRRYNLEVVVTFLKVVKEIAPIYYVSGNHEALSGKYDDIKSALINENVIVLDDEMVKITKKGYSIDILGLTDPSFSTIENNNNMGDIRKNIKKWKDNRDFKILLSHHPEYINLYSENNMDLVLSGHAHGGQVIIPFIGGLIAPAQGLFPKYTSGYYEQNQTTLYVNRGLGNSLFPLRVFNRPEISIITLNNK